MKFKERVFLLLGNFLILLLLERFTNSDRTPPYVDTYAHFFSNFWKLRKKRSPIRMNLKRLRTWGEENYPHAFFTHTAKGSATTTSTAANRVAKFELRVVQSCNTRSARVALIIDFATIVAPTQERDT